MTPLDLKLMVSEMFKLSMRAERAHERLFEAIDRHDKFSTVPTSAEIRDWLVQLNRAIAAREEIHYVINEIMDEMEDVAEAAAAAAAAAAATAARVAGSTPPLNT